MRKILLAAGVAILVISALGIVYLAALSQPPLQSGTYGGSLEVEPADYRPATFEGRHPNGASFLVLNVTFHNTGSIEVNFNRSSWAILNPYGQLLRSPSGLFNSSLSAPAQQTTRGPIVFDIEYWDNVLASLSALLPDGAKITVPLTSNLQIAITYSFSSDLTNWTLIVQSTPLAIALPAVKLTIRSSAGAVLLPPKPLGSLAYAGDHAAYLSFNSSWLSTGDRLCLSVQAYPRGSQIELWTSAKMWFATTLQG
jgi:hypothetical protein